MAMSWTTMAPCAMVEAGTSGGARAPLAAASPRIDVRRRTAETAATTLQSELLAAATLVEDRRGRSLNNQNEAQDDFYANDGDDDDDAAISLTGYSLKYTKCQPVQYFSSDAIAAGEHSPMITEDIVLLRLCASCSSGTALGCNSNYADYAITVAHYVRIMLKYSALKQETACDYCQACGYAAAADGGNRRNNRRKLDDEDAAADENDQGGGANEQQQQQQQQAAEGDDFYQAGKGDDAAYEDCSLIDSICPKYTCDAEEDNNNNNNNYLDYDGYMNYLNCAQVNYNGYAYFVQPRCDGDSGSIKMAVFYDNYCGSYAGGEVSVKNLGVGFREGFFQDYYSGECIDCSTSKQPPFYNLNNALCNKIHGDAAKCTANSQNEDLSAEQQQEDATDTTECSYIESLRFGTYDSKGKLSYASGVIDWDSEVTTMQLLLLTTTSLLVVLFLVYACYLHHSMTNLLIKSLSHRELLPPSRHAKRPIV
jgi:hypothetical protein